jgi:hypothetical protein
VIKCQCCLYMERFLKGFEESTNKNYPGSEMVTVFNLLPKLRMLDIIVMHQRLHSLLLN